MKSKLTFIQWSTPRIRTNGRKRKRALFQCGCGDIKDYDYSAVNTGRKISCPKCSRKRAKESMYTHRLIKHPLYGKWQDMKKRCYNPKVDRYNVYGGRGIKVCKKWKNDFKAFYDWCLDNGWEKELTLDRINVNKNYTPFNCRFTSALHQGFNMKNTIYVEVYGKEYSLTGLMYYCNKPLKSGTVRAGVMKGKSIDYYIDKYDLDFTESLKILYPRNE